MSSPPAPPLGSQFHGAYLKMTGRNVNKAQAGARAAHLGPPLNPEQEKVCTLDCFWLRAPQLIQLPGPCPCFSSSCKMAACGHGHGCKQQRSGSLRAELSSPPSDKNSGVLPSISPLKFIMFGCHGMEADFGVGLAVSFYPYLSIMEGLQLLLFLSHKCE